MKLQYISDLHLEMHAVGAVSQLMTKIVAKADICVLAGDIGYPYQSSYQNFLQGISKKFKHVFLIHGNHEYYQRKENIGKSMNDVVLQTKKILPHNVHFLHNSHYDLDGYRFIGSVLWSHIEDCKFLVNDVHCIGEFNVVNNNKLHKHNFKFLENEIQQSVLDNMKAIVITHHLPSWTLIDSKYDIGEYRNYSQCFASHCDDLIVDPVCCWIYGHTHTAGYSVINNIPCVTNPIGYPGENNANEIDYNKVIDLSNT
jgi:predicted phosphodiesterase